MNIKKSILKRINKKKIKREEKELITKALSEISPERKVKNGPFKGMIYPESKSVGSSFFPKILGSYEAELHDIIKKILSNNYHSIVDIGCAEGYYAVGLAMQLKDTFIYAYDQDPDAISLCKKMYNLNNVDHKRVHFGSFCTPDTLKSLNLQNSLIICDCEGYEKNIFTESLVQSLKKNDFLIETHDCIDINISTQIYNALKETHDIEIIESIDDILKAKYYNYNELENYTLEEKKILLAEKRKSIMEWFYAVPKKN
ncbi:MAG: methyltransferase [Candidatus Muiribacteriota bacterium]